LNSQIKAPYHGRGREFEFRRPAILLKELSNATPETRPRNRTPGFNQTPLRSKPEGDASIGHEHYLPSAKPMVRKQSSSRHSWSTVSTYIDQNPFFASKRLPIMPKGDTSDNALST
jgi:hypothetical protein